MKYNTGSGGKNDLSLSQCFVFKHVSVNFRELVFFSLGEQDLWVESVLESISHVISFFHINFVYVIQELGYSTSFSSMNKLLRSRMC